MNGLQVQQNLANSASSLNRLGDSHTTFFERGEDHTPGIEEAAPAGFLSLPSELLSQITSLVAPLGGKKLAPLRLVNRHLRDLVTPHMFTCVIFSKDAVRLDALLAFLYGREDDIIERVKSVWYEVPIVEPDLPIVFMRKLANLERLMVSNFARKDAIGLFNIVPRLSTLRSLVLKGVNISNQFHDWPNTIQHLTLDNCPGVFRLRYGRLVLKSLTVLNGRVARDEFETTLRAAILNVDQITLTWNTDAPVVFGAPNPFTFPNRTRPFSLRIIGFPLWTLAAAQGAPPFSSLINVLQWVSAWPLDSLCLPVGKKFETGAGFHTLSLPRLRQLTLSTDPSSYVVDSGPKIDLFGPNSYRPLTFFLTSLSAPSLLTLVLRGWFDFTTVSKIARAPIHTFPMDYLHLYGLLGVLKNTRVVQLRLENSEGHLDDSSCVFWRDEEGGEWKSKLC